MRRENINSLYVLLFLNVAFFFLQLQDAQHYMSLFAFERSHVLAGEVWRLFTYQFLQGSFLGSGAISLFFTLLILYIMGSALEELWGTRSFLVFYFLSLFGTAAVGFLLGAPLIGSFFLTYSLLFVYAHIFREQTFLLFFILPVKVTWIAFFAGAMLLLGVLALDPSSLAALGGVIASFGYYSAFESKGKTIFRPRQPLAPPPPTGFSAPPPAKADSSDADRNLETFRKIRQSIESGTPEEREALVKEIEPEIIRGVNICPPADYKPEAADRYCIQCEGFPECSVRYMNLNAPAPDPAESPEPAESEDDLAEGRRGRG
jgi:membrane associated rhomboid family serine protease